MRYDKPLLAVLFGFLATIPYEIFTRMLVASGVGKYSVYNLASLIVTMDRPSALLGFVISGTIGATTGLVYYYALKWLGRDYLVTKSLAVGILTWVITETIFVWLIEGPRLSPPRPTADYFIHLLGALIYGLVMGLLFRRYLLKKASRV